MATEVPSVVSDLPGIVEPTSSTPTIETHVSSDTELLPSRKGKISSDHGGPGIEVSAFRLNGANDHPDLRIRIAEMEGLIEEFRARRMADSKQLAFSDIQEAADIITNYYRERGLIVAKAFVLAQDVVDRVVTITVLEGRLGAVKVELPENPNYTKEQFESLFSDQRGRPVVKAEIERALLMARDYPGVRISGVLSPDAKPGDTDLIIKVREEKRMDGLLSVDNYGSVYTGRTRVHFGLGFNNLAGVADRLDINLLKGIGETNLYGSGQYGFPISDGRTHIGVGYSLNNYEAGAELEALDVDGTSETVRFYLKRDFLRSRARRLTGLFDLSRKDSEVTFGGRNFSRDKLLVMGLMLNAQTTDSVVGNRRIGVNQFSLGHSHGFKGILGALDGNDPNSSRTGASGEKASGQFNKIVAGYRRHQYLTEDMALMLKFQGQWSDDMLVSIEQLSFGGPDNVRAYPRSEFMGDKGYFGSVELFFDIQKPDEKIQSSVKKIQASVFVDYAKGWLNYPSASREEAASLVAVGLGLRVNIRDILTGRLQIATPLGTQTANNDKDPQVFAELQWHF